MRICMSETWISRRSLKTKQALVNTVATCRHSTTIIYIELNDSLRFLNKGFVPALDGVSCLPQTQLWRIPDSPEDKLICSE